MHLAGHGAHATTHRSRQHSSKPSPRLNSLGCRAQALRRLDEVDRRADDVLRALRVGQAAWICRTVDLGSSGLYVAMTFVGVGRSNDTDHLRGVASSRDRDGTTRRAARCL